jgi:hypothetical protein
MLGNNKNSPSLFVVVVAGFFSITAAAITNPQGFEYVKNQAEMFLANIQRALIFPDHGLPAKNHEGVSGLPSRFPQCGTNDASSFGTDAAGRIRIILPPEMDTEDTFPRP